MDKRGCLDGVPRIGRMLIGWTAMHAVSLKQCNGVTGWAFRHGMGNSHGRSPSRNRYRSPRRRAFGR